MSPPQTHMIDLGTLACNSAILSQELKKGTNPGATTNSEDIPTSSISSPISTSGHLGKNCNVRQTGFNHIDRRDARSRPCWSDTADTVGTTQPYTQKTEPMLMLPHLLFEEERLPMLHARGSWNRCFECPCFAAIGGKRHSDLDVESNGKNPEDSLDLLTRTAPSEADLCWSDNIGFRVVVNDTVGWAPSPRSSAMAEKGDPRTHG